MTGGSGTVAIALAVAVHAAYLDLASDAVWPGFTPREIPLAIYDGQQTWLFDHPSPPAGFAPYDSNPRVRVRDGRAPEVIANTSTLLAGVSTATLVLKDQLSRDPDSTRAFAAVAMHESFHVFQRARHPRWSPNEGELFLYPADDESLLAGVHLELTALRQAVADTPATAGGWAAAALEARRLRFARLSEGSVTYERGSEWNEGLAQYVQNRALRLSRGDTATPVREPGRAGILGELTFAADAVRRRSYVTGEAWAILLDRFLPGWRDSLEADDSRPLDALLAGALESKGTRPAAFSDAELRDASSAARMNVEDLRARRSRARQEFLRRAGSTLVFEAGGEPLWPQGFDPWNVQSLGGHEILHTRYVKLGNGSGALEVLDRAALTEAAGTHPLFEGVRRVTITGLEIPPDLQSLESGEHELLPGVRASFRGARIERRGNDIFVHLP